MKNLRPQEDPINEAFMVLLAQDRITPRAILILQLFGVDKRDRDEMSVSPFLLLLLLLFLRLGFFLLPNWLWLVARFELITHIVEREVGYWFHIDHKT